MPEFDVVWRGREPLTATPEIDYEDIEEPWTVIYWPPPLVFDYMRSSLTVISSSAWRKWNAKLPVEDRRCAHCQRLFQPVRRTVTCCSERCQQAHVRRTRRQEAGRRVRVRREPGFCAKGHLLKAVGVVVNKGYEECRECHIDRSRRANARKRAKRLGGDRTPLTECSSG